MDIRDRRLKARLSKWSTCSVETKRGLVKPRKVIMLKRFLSYYKPQMGLFVADTVCALVLAAIDLAFPIILRNLTGGLFAQGQAAIMQALGIEQKQFPINMIRSKISSAKNAMIGPEDMLKSADSPNDKKAAQVYMELERRLRAARMAGLHEVPCIIMELDLEEASFIALVENLQRNDLDFLEEARGIAQLIRLFGLSQEECARRLGKSQSAVANKLRLLRLPEDVLNAMRNAGLTERHGRALLRLETPAEQREALAYILSRDLNVAATDAYIERLLEAKTAPESEQQKTFILKDVRVFLNTISHSLDLMKQGGIDAGMHRQETDEALILTINIPKARRREPAPKQGEPVPVG